MIYDLAVDNWGAEEKAAIMGVIDSGRLTMGPKVAEFGEAFSKYFGSKYTVMLNSGSSANLISVASLFFRKKNPLVAGDEVIVPAIASLQPFLHCSNMGLSLSLLMLSWKLSIWT